MNYTGNGQYNLQKLSLFYDDNGTEKELDLSVAFVHVDLYESIWDNAMSGSVAITDTFGLVELIKLYGGERVELEFSTVGTEQIIEYTGIVYKVSEKHRITEHASGYIIYFNSEEVINSMRTQTQRAFKSEISNIVTSIFGGIKTNKPLEVTKTTGIKGAVFGVHKPIEAINILCADAVSQNNEHGYLFFENNVSYNFKPVELLFKGEPVREYYYRNAGMFNEVSQRVNESFGAIQDIAFLEENSYLDRIVEGQHGVTSEKFDLGSKEIRKAEYDRTKGSVGLATQRVRRNIEPSYQSKSKIRLGFDSVIPEMDYTKNKMVLTELNTIRFQITVFGDSSIKAGDVCVATIPNWNQDQDEVKGDVSGKFLIGSIHHALSPTTYMQTILIQKEGYEQ